MALNLVTEVTRSISPAAIERIAAALGINASLAQKAIAAAVPAILGALGQTASTADGAEELYQAVNRADPGVFDKLATTLSGARAQIYMDSGTSSLNSLIGSLTTTSIGDAIARYAGLGGTAGSSLLSIAAPMVLGGLAKSGAGTDASGLANLLGSQRENVRSALPAGLTDMLSDAGIFGGRSSYQAGGPAVDFGRTANAPVSGPARVAQTNMNWMMWLIPLVLIAAAVWYVLANRTPALETTVDTTTTTPAVTDMTLDGVDIGKQVTTTLDGISSSLGGITDLATAQAALPKLQEAVTAVDGLSGMLGKLSATQKTTLAGLVAAALPAIKDAATKALAIQGVSDVAKPVVDDLIAKLESLAQST
jgi:hypothetical protein